jgi:hypothetical protein
MLPMADESKNFNRAVGELTPERLAGELGEAVPDTCIDDFEDLPDTPVDEGPVEDVMGLGPEELAEALGAVAASPFIPKPIEQSAQCIFLTCNNHLPIRFPPRSKTEYTFLRKVSPINH